MFNPCGDFFMKTIITMFFIPVINGQLSGVIPVQFSKTKGGG